MNCTICRHKISSNCNYNQGRCPHRTSKYSKWTMFRSPIMVVLLIAVIAASFYFKKWQCEQMFPNADIVACLFWK